MKVRALGEQADLMADLSGDRKGAIDTSPLFALISRLSALGGTWYFFHLRDLQRPSSAEPLPFPAAGLVV